MGKQNKQRTLLEQGHHIYIGTVHTNANPPRGGWNMIRRRDLQKNHDAMVGIVTHMQSDGGCGAHTEVTISTSELGQPFTYLCSGCGQTLTFSQILLREPDPLVFHLFGDESIGRGVVVYGIIVFNLSDVNAAAEDFRNLISSYGLPPETRFHCREVFAGDARNKTSWRHMSEKQVWEVAEQLLLKLNTHRPQYCLGIVYRDAFPSVLASGSGSKRIDVQEEHLYPLAFAGALQPLVDLELVSPDIESHLWFDPLNKKLEFWGAGALQVQRVFSHNNLIIEKVDDGKPLLLDAADIFSYVAGRAVSREDSRHKAKCQELLGLCHPRIGIGSWIPP